MKPFIKWAGGKGSIAPQIVDRFPKHFGRYWEPFLGGGAVFFYHERFIGEAVLSDMNHDLVITYQQLRDYPQEVTLRVINHFDLHNGEVYYYRQRHIFNHHPDLHPFERAALFIYMNWTGYNGLYRVNQKGEYNVPCGRPSPYTKGLINKKRLLAAAAALQRTEIVYQDYQDITPTAGDLIYLDPPYMDTFNQYVVHGFSIEDHQNLAAKATEWMNIGAFVFVSHLKDPRFRQLYSGKLWEHIRMEKVRNSIGRTQKSRKPRNEILLVPKNIDPRLVPVPKIPRWKQAKMPTDNIMI